MRTHTWPWTAVGVLLATIGALLQTPAQPARPSTVAGFLPAGAALVLQARDFSSVLADWNASPEKASWLESENYQAFSRSQLFLRLSEAYDEFAGAAGVPVDLTLVADVAGGESALAIYDIGKLEFLYVTRLPAARVMENALWRTRGSYEPREAAGTPFYVRSDADTERVVAFGVRDEYLLLATRADLIAGALALIGGQAASAVPSERWYAQSIQAAGASGDLRLVVNLETLVRQPHFRSYWIQDNVTELRAFSSGVVDLFRTPTEIREERVFIRVEEQPAGSLRSGALGEVLRLVPDDAGLYRAWVAPSAGQVTDLIFRKIIAPGASSSGRDRSAPSIASLDAGGGGYNDFESRIDLEPRARTTVAYQTAALTRLIEAAPVRAMLHLESTRTGADAVFIDRGSVIAVARQADWPPGAARGALRAVVAPMWTKGEIGLEWTETRRGSQSFWQLPGLEPMAVAERGPWLFVATDPALLAATLDALPSPALDVPGSYAGGFRHSQERHRFVRMMRVIDQGVARTDDRGPMFFSGNLASLSETLARADAASIVVREAATTVSQTMTYRIVR